MHQALPRDAGNHLRRNERVYVLAAGSNRRDFLEVPLRETRADAVVLVHVRLARQPARLVRRMPLFFRHVAPRLLEEQKALDARQRQPHHVLVLFGKDLVENLLYRFLQKVSGVGHAHIAQALDRSPPDGFLHVGRAERDDCLGDEFRHHIALPRGQSILEKRNMRTEVAASAQQPQDPYQPMNSFNLDLIGSRNRLSGMRPKFRDAGRCHSD